ncbi:hypothetical protein [Arthrobacter koreensis]|uniref:hypothetical protein n=1 Tax=Arthrobacter koreensis TaxID=199136 RepID=UPI002409B980|nr:hypothetical protein [Arthrobacter koreensis]
MATLAGAGSASGRRRFRFGINPGNPGLLKAVAAGQVSVRFVGYNDGPSLARGQPGGVLLV